MAKYLVTWVERQRFAVEVEADSQEEAEDKIYVGDYGMKYSYTMGALDIQRVRSFLLDE